MSLKRLGVAIATGGASEGPLAMLGKKMMKDAESGAPQRESISLDQDTQNFMDQRADRSLRSTDQIADEQLAGTDSYGADVQDSISDQNRFSGGLAMQEPADLDQALQKRGDASFKNSLGDLRRQAKLKAGDVKISQGSAAGQYKAAQRNIAARALGIERENIAAKKAAKYALIGSVIQIGATIGGAMIGGPAGAAAANQATAPAQPAPSNYTANSRMKSQMPPRGNV